jgi:hypothetical protein
VVRMVESGDCGGAKGDLLGFGQDADQSERQYRVVRQLVGVVETQVSEARPGAPGLVRLLDVTILLTHPWIAVKLRSRGQEWRMDLSSWMAWWSSWSAV